MKPPHIELHIEELILHGFSEHDRFRIAEAIKNELLRIIAEHPIHPQWRENLEIDRVDAGAFDVAPNSQPAAIGGQIAQSVHEGITT